MTNDIKDFINGTQFSCGSQAKDGDLAYPDLKKGLATVMATPDQSCDYVANAYNKFKGVTYHCGSASLKSNTKTKINSSTLVKAVKAKGR